MFTNNIVYGRLEGPNLSEVIVKDNIIIHESDDSEAAAVYFFRHARDVTIASNYIVSLGGPGLKLEFNNAFAPDGINVSGNIVLSRGTGINVAHARAILISSNMLRSFVADLGTVGINCESRRTDPTVSMQRISIIGNDINDYGIAIKASARVSNISGLDISLNVLTYGPGGAQGVVFTREDPGVFEDVQILGNVSGNGISRPLVNVGALPFFAIGGPIAGGVGIYMGTQAPGDLVPASPGPLYLQMGESGGATMFVNETGDAAGWRRV